MTVSPRGISYESVKNWTRITALPEESWLALFQFVESHNISKIDLSQLSVTDRDAEQIATHARVAKCLQVLCVNNHQMSKKGASVLKAAINVQLHFGESVEPEQSPQDAIKDLRKQVKKNRRRLQNIQDQVDMISHLQTSNRESLIDQKCQALFQASPSLELFYNDVQRELTAIAVGIFALKSGKVQKAPDKAEKGIGYSFAVLQVIGDIGLGAALGAATYGVGGALAPLIVHPPLALIEAGIHKVRGERAKKATAKLAKTYTSPTFEGIDAYNKAVSYGLTLLLHTHIPKMSEAEREKVIKDWLDKFQDAITQGTYKPKKRKTPKEVKYTLKNLTAFAGDAYPWPEQFEYARRYGCDEENNGFLFFSSKAAAKIFMGRFQTVWTVTTPKPIWESPLKIKADDVPIPAYLDDQVKQLPPAAPCHIFRHLPRSLDENQKLILYGLGGSGKTQIARDYVLENWHRFGAVHWVRARRPEQLALDLWESTLRYTLATNISGCTPKQLIALSCSHLKHISSQLIIFDNLTKKCARLIENLPDVKIIITTRKKNLIDKVPEEPIECFSPEEAQSFLAKALPNESSSALNALAQALGNHPLALTHASAYIKQADMTPSLYLNRLKDLGPCDLKFSKGLPPTVYKAWKTTFKALTPKSHELLMVLSLLAPDIDKDLILAIQDVRHKYESLRQLSNYSFLLKGEDSYHLHPLVQQIVAAEIPLDKRPHILAKGLNLLIERAEFKAFNPYRFETIQPFEVVMPHYSAFIKAIQSWTPNPQNLEDLIYLIQTLGRYHLRISKDLVQAQNLFEQALRLCHHLPDKKQAYTAWCQYRLGLLKLRQRHYSDAIELFDKAYQGFSDYNEDFTSLKLESNQAKWGQTYALAIIDLERVLTQYRLEVIAPEKCYKQLSDLIPRFNAASAGDITLQFDVPRILREQANIRLHQKDYEQAKKMLKKALEQQEKIYNATPNTSFETSPTVVTTYAMLAKAYYASGEKALAIDCQRKSHEVNVTIYKDESHPYLQRSLQALNQYLEEANNPDNELSTKSFSQQDNFSVKAAIPSESETLENSSLVNLSPDATLTDPISATESSASSPEKEAEEDLMEIKTESPAKIAADNTKSGDNFTEKLE